MDFKENNMADVDTPLGPIQEDDFAIIADCFCAASPIPQQQVEVDGELQYDEDGPVMENTCTVLEHMVQGIIKYVIAVTEKGYYKKQKQGDPPDKELINRVLSNL
jgi:hypothetical protein